MKPKVRVIHVIESFAGGAFTSVTQIVNHLDPAHYEVYLVHALRPETPENFRSMIADHVQVVYLPMIRELSLVQDLKCFFRLLSLFRALRPDIVHLHSSKAGVLGRIAARMARIPKIFYSPRGFSFLREDVSPIQRRVFVLLEKVASRFGGVTVGCSQGEFDAARSIGQPAVLLNNALDLTIFEQLGAGRGSRTREGVTIATSGRISAQKNPALFARLARGVSQARPGQVRFLWIGAGECDSELAGAPVEILGWRSREETLLLLRDQVDIYLHTSRWEGMPLSILEAMALGLPVIATDVIGNRDAVSHGITGFVSSETEVLEEALLDLIDHGERRDAMGVAGRRKIEDHHSIPVLMNDIEKLYNQSTRGGHESRKVA